MYTKSNLYQDIYLALKDQFSQQGTSPQVAQQQVADKIASAIEKYVTNAATSVSQMEYELPLTVYNNKLYLPAASATKDGYMTKEAYALLYSLSGGVSVDWTGGYTTYDARYVQLGGSYTNPAWLVSLPWSKITGAPAFLTTEVDPVFTGSPAFTISNLDITHWDTAYGWGDHSLAGYLTSETDPVFSASAAAGITGTNISNWNTAFGWGNHAAAGYLTTAAANALYVQLAGSYANPTWITSLAWAKITGAPAFITTETDPVFTASAAAGISGTDISNWNTAFGWGNHTSAGYLTSATAASTYVALAGSYANPTWITSLAWAKITGAPAFLTTETDPVFSASAAFAITGTDISNWNTAFGWGNHASAGYLLSSTAASTYVSLSGSYTNPTWLVSIPWSKITSTPTTIAGYGITDFNSLGDARWSLLAHTHTFASLTSKPTTVSGYGITDALTTAMLDTDAALAANSNSLVPSQAAVKSYVDGKNYVFVRFDHQSLASPANSTAYYGGNLVEVISSNTPARCVPIPYGCTLDYVMVEVYVTTGNTGIYTFAFNLLNGSKVLQSSNTLGTSAFTANSTLVTLPYNSSPLPITCTAGYFWVMKVTTPAANQVTNFRFSGLLAFRLT